MNLLTHYGPMMSQILVNIGSGNGFVPDGISISVYI